MRASPPPVTVTTSSDFWLTEIRAGRCFMRGVTTPGPVNNPEVQLYNPVGSGVQVTCYFMMHDFQTAGGLFELHRYDTQLATDVGAGFNCLMGGAAAQAHIRRGEAVAPGDGTYQLGWDPLSGNARGVFPPWLFELSPGQGMLVYYSAATPIMGNFWWREGA
jgi:hypothetical protein